MNEPQVPPENTAPEAASQEPEKAPPLWREVASTLGILATAIAVAVVIILFIFRSYQVDGPSMQNTLHNGDKLIIWKLPRTWARITGSAYIPARGDIIVFNESGLSAFGQQNDKQLIKRVIGLPGDHIVINNGINTIYNKTHPHGFDPDKSLGYFTKKSLPYTSGNINITLGSDQLFVEGDNRPDSLDSRSFGPINASQIIGQLILRVFPLGNAKVF